MLTLKTSDGIEVHFNDYVAYQCILLREMYYPDVNILSGGEVKFADPLEIHIENGEVLQTFHNISAIIERNKYSVETIKNTEHITDLCMEINAIITKLKDNKIFNILNMANYLQNNYVIEILKKSMLSYVRDNSFEDIRKKFNLTNEDFTIEEYNQIQVFGSLVRYYDDETLTLDTE